MQHTKISLNGIEIRNVCGRRNNDRREDRILDLSVALPVAFSIMALVGVSLAVVGVDFL
jgi:hypothetical protein